MGNHIYACEITLTKELYGYTFLACVHISKICGSTCAHIHVPGFVLEEHATT